MFSMKALFALVGFVWLANELVVAQNYLPTQLDVISVSNPGFPVFIPNPTNKNSFHVAISSFNGIPWSKDFVSYVANYSANKDEVKRLDNTKLLWPNGLSVADRSLINSTTDPYGGLLVPGGFLVPTKTDGGVFYYPFTSKDRSQIWSGKPIDLSIKSTSKTDWFYHQVELFDVNGDGVKDLLTCRANKPIIGSSKHEMVAFIFDSATQSFVEHVIMKDVCDVHFAIADLDKDGREEIIASGFFFSRLNVIYSTDKFNSFINGNVQVTTIDDQGGEFFDVAAVDLDLESDKRLELLVTNHQGNKGKVKPAIFYYKLSGNVRTGSWTRYTVSTDFKVIKFGINSAAPGTARAFWPKVSDENKKRPYLFVSGDGSEKAYVFQPNDKGPLNYTQVWQQHYKGYTVGGSSIADVNGDGYAEVVVSAYESNKCYVYTFKPTAN